MNIIITGTSQGVGFELVKHLSQEHTVYALTSSPEKLLSKANQLSINIIEYDFLKHSTDTVVDQLPETIDILINNAGALINKTFDKITQDDIENLFTINVKTPMLLIQSIMPKLIKSNVKHVVNIGSMGGIIGSQKFQGLSVYSATKGALAVLTECLSVEYRNQGVRFNCLALGSVQTEMFSKAFSDFRANIAPACMAKYIAGFATDGWKYFNGQVINVTSSNI